MVIQICNYVGSVWDGIRKSNVRQISGGATAAKIAYADPDRLWCEGESARKESAMALGKKAGSL